MATRPMGMRHAVRALESARIDAGGATDAFLQRAYNLQLAKVAVELAKHYGDAFPLERFVGCLRTDP